MAYYAQRTVARTQAETATRISQDAATIKSKEIAQDILRERLAFVLALQGAFHQTNLSCNLIRGYIDAIRKNDFSENARTKVDESDNMYQLIKLYYPVLKKNNVLNASTEISRNQSVGVQLNYHSLVYVLSRIDNDVEEILSANERSGGLYRSQLESVEQTWPKLLERIKEGREKCVEHTTELIKLLPSDIRT